MVGWVQHSVPERKNRKTVLTLTENRIELKNFVIRKKKTLNLKMHEIEAKKIVLLTLRL